MSFDDFELEKNIKKALKKRSFKQPTAVQKALIPKVLVGKDALVTSPTGTGKTIAYTVPLLNNVFIEKERESFESTIEPKPYALICVPTSDLTLQVADVISNIAMFTHVMIAGLTTLKKAEIRGFVQNVDIIVCTPAHVRKVLEIFPSFLSNIRTVILDEADMLVAYQYGADLKEVLSRIPSKSQRILVSATLPSAVQDIAKLALREPEVVDMKDLSTAASKDSFPTHLVIRIPEKEKMYVLFALIKLGLIQGRCLVFVNKSQRAYALRLMLSMFGVDCACLTGDVPVESRKRAVEQFNRGVIQTLFVADPGEAIDVKVPLLEKEEEGEEDDKVAAKETDTLEGDSSRKSSADDFSGSRGIDYKFVSCVINYDIPLNPRSLIHRSGRTKRGHAKKGTVLTLCADNEGEFDGTMIQKGCALSFPTEEAEQQRSVVAAAAREMAALTGQLEDVVFKHFAFDMSVVDPFKYRINSAISSVTHRLVERVRASEIRKELLRSKDLCEKLHLNFNDLKLLHTVSLKEMGKSDTLSSFPSYLKPTKATIEDKIRMREEMKLSCLAGSMTHKQRAKAKKQQQKREKRAKKTEKKLGHGLKSKTKEKRKKIMKGGLKRRK
ncbi:hypothetical protein ADUPG1_010835 [Aduncisulcus paluster]|uniref:Uncharacterized protein n=1 Tax=Aduncisulcus paluster TaxID=2918883 RepID=A0ABQ5JU42_9EUKA|nr:hypothetical protein ADUPG1_010835 [Aduncisulcus paluster]|eukprot:gnl/Carplike_NY0171/3991_a5396_280.p1 GENE.gnl/Carplike_NY0171/3991_a5396_280~~gnl/Carplike_NY0171/3991_a5396_280.p1  ORF type:complete len:611 (-),score=151.94 gnl/Carplike_NY0171/3991_a5396_280:52-1884(-)